MKHLSNARKISIVIAIIIMLIGFIIFFRLPNSSIISPISSDSSSSSRGWQVAIYPWFIGGGLFLLLMGGFILDYIADYRIRKNGILTMGKITSAVATGIKRNKVPQLELGIEFSLPNGDIVHSSAKRIFSKTDLKKLDIGISIPIRYDENDPKKISIDMKSSKEDIKNTNSNSGEKN